MSRTLALALCAALVPALALAQARPAASAPGAPATGAAAPAAPGAPRPAGRPAGPANAKAGAPVDLTGQWVALVTEDWRWRMLTPPKGDSESVPLNAEGRRVGAQWDLAADNAAGLQCKAFGAGAVSRLPTRMRISWADDNTLKLETDAGQQTRLFKFVQPAPGAVVPALEAAYSPTGERTWQGDSRAEWYKQPQSRGLAGARPGPPGSGGALRVVTRNQKAGYLRKNGVPYSEDAVITEQFNAFTEANGDVRLTVTTIVFDPKYLAAPFIVSSDFKREAAPGKWNPTPCATTAPLEPPLKVERNPLAG